jgi:hypothetical protein
MTGGAILAAATTAALDYLTNYRFAFPFRLPLYRFTSDLIKIPGNAYGLQILNRLARQNHSLYPVLIGAITATLLASGWLVMHQPFSTRSRWTATQSFVFLGGLVLLPGIFSEIFSHLVFPMWLIRYFMPSVMVLLLLISSLAGQLRQRWIAVALIGMVAANSLAFIGQYFGQPDGWKEDWRGASTYLLEHAQPNDTLVLCRGYYGFQSAYEYYLPNIPFETFVPKTRFEAEPNDQIRRLAQNADRLWLIALGSDCNSQSGQPDIPALQDYPITVVRFSGITLFAYP